MESQITVALTTPGQALVTVTTLHDASQHNHNAACLHARRYPLQNRPNEWKSMPVLRIAVTVTVEQRSIFWARTGKGHNVRRTKPWGGFRQAAEGFRQGEGKR